MITKYQTQYNELLALTYEAKGLKWLDEQMPRLSCLPLYLIQACYMRGDDKVDKYVNPDACLSDYMELVDFYTNGEKITIDELIESEHLIEQGFGIISALINTKEVTLDFLPLRKKSVPASYNLDAYRKHALNTVGLANASKTMSDMLVEECKYSFALENFESLEFLIKNGIERQHSSMEYVEFLSKLNNDFDNPTSIVIQSELYRYSEGFGNGFGGMGVPRMERDIACIVVLSNGETVDITNRYFMAQQFENKVLKKGKIELRLVDYGRAYDDLIFSPNDIVNITY
jgi:hypothetical protein